MKDRPVVRIIILLLIVSWSCREEPSPPAGLESVFGPAQPGQAKTEQDSDREAARLKHEEMLKAYGREKEIMVGGCRESCEDPMTAARAFLRCLWGADSLEAPCLVSHVNTAALVDRGRPLGKGWAGRYKSGELLERRREIEAWARDFAGTMGSVKNPAELEDILEHELVMTRISSELVEIVLPLPETSTMGKGRIWKFTFNKRGLEWLVAGIGEE